MSTVTRDDAPDDTTEPSKRFEVKQFSGGPPDLEAYLNELPADVQLHSFVANTGGWIMAVFERAA